MKEKKSLAEEALLQMKQVEEVIAENAKGILASTMKEEINQLVKESLSEKEDDDVETDDDMDDMDTSDVDVDMDDMDTSDADVDMDDMESDDESEMDSDMVDLTGASDEEILKVFKAMGEEDGIIIKKDGEDIHLTDNDADTEYLIKLGESVEDYNRFEGDLEEEIDDEKVDDVINAIFQDGSVSMSDDEEVDDNDVVYEIHMDEDNDFDQSMDYGVDGEGEGEEPEIYEMYEDMDGNSEYFDNQSSETIYEIQMDEDNDFDQSMDYGVDGEGEGEEPEIYEMYEDMDGNSEYIDGEFNEGDFDPEFIKNLESGEENEEWTNESYSHKKAKKSIKPKGRVGSGPKFTYGKTTGGFSEKKKEGQKTMGTGKPKFVYKQGENMGGKNKMVGKKIEAKEASRTYGMGSKEGRGLRKAITPNRNLKLESLESEIGMLREKNEEYRKALNVFREKLNEVAIFNSNLAYATRLFTEHSTTKKEKINILRRFDGVDTLKESKNLYRAIREELSTGESKSINESVENKINKTVSTGSSTTLIESKTYENPQFMRIKDLMGKIV